MKGSYLGCILLDMQSEFFFETLRFPSSSADQHFGPCVVQLVDIDLLCLRRQLGRIIMHENDDDFSIT
jgi:hypothetical protein